MAMRALENERVTRTSGIMSVPFRVSDEDAFMDTFDQYDTLSEGWYEHFNVRHKVQVSNPVDEIGLLILLWKQDPFLNDPHNKTDRDAFDYELSCLIHGGEQAYLDSFFQ